MFFSFLQYLPEISVFSYRKIPRNIDMSGKILKKKLKIAYRDPMRVAAT